MWAPSFVDVLLDLWRFCIGQHVEVKTLEQEPLNSGLFFDRNHSKQHTQSTPCLEEGVTYSATHATTKKIRLKLVNYDAHLARAGVLTNKEWLLYLISVRNTAVPLLALQLTPLGHWHTTLKGQPDVVVGIAPYTKSLMEWNGSDGAGHTAVVHNVTPEETITLAQVNSVPPGQYLIQTLEKKDWLELRPVFITIV